MNNREYLIELVKLRMIMWSGMKLWRGLNAVLISNSNKADGLTAEDRREIKKVMDRIRRKHNNDIYAQDSALKAQAWVRFTDGHGWTHIKNMRKHDNPKGEGTE